MDYKYTQLSHTYPHDGNRCLRNGTLLEVRLKNASTLSSQRTIFPRINIMGIVGNPTRSTNGSAFSITDKPSLWPTTWRENRLQSYLQIESPVSTTVFSILKQEMCNSLKLRLLVMEQLYFSECSIMLLRHWMANFKNWNVLVQHKDMITNWTVNTYTVSSKNAGKYKQNIPSGKTSHHNMIYAH